MLFLPESPRWMLSRGKEGGAKRMLRWLGSSDVEGELRLLKEALCEAMAQPRGALAGLFEPWLGSRFSLARD
jgi:MFS transporter, SP family, sugar:H+ symporter